MSCYRTKITLGYGYHSYAYVYIVKKLYWNCLYFLHSKYFCYRYNARIFPKFTPQVLLFPFFFTRSQIHLIIKALLIKKHTHFPTLKTISNYQEITALKTSEHYTRLEASEGFHVCNQLQGRNAT